MARATADKPLATDPPWLKLAYAEIGVAEIPGAKNNPRIMQTYLDCGWRIEADENGPAEIKHETTPWCAAQMGSWLKRCEYPIPLKPIALLAHSYESYGAKVPFNKAKNDYSQVRRGDIVITRRDADPKSWKRHVTLWAGETDLAFKGLGGNQGDSIKISSIAKSTIVAIRRPIEPTKAALKEAGSTEMVIADDLRKGGIAVVAAAAATKGGEVALTPAIPVAPSASSVAVPAPSAPVPSVAPAVPTPSPNLAEQLRDGTEQVGIVKTFMEGCRGIGQGVMDSPWLIVTAVIVVVVLIVARRIEANRIKRFKAGHGLSQQQTETIAEPGEPA